MLKIYCKAMLLVLFHIGVPILLRIRLLRSHDINTTNKGRTGKERSTQEFYDVFVPSHRKLVSSSLFLLCYTSFPSFSFVGCRGLGKRLFLSSFPPSRHSLYWFGFNVTRSSIRKIVIAASVAKRRLLIFDIAGSTTPAARLSRTSPAIRSNP